jgi:hypothetical protein
VSAQAVKGQIRDLPLHLLRLDHTLPKSTGVLCCGTSTSQQMEDQKHDTHNEDDVNESSGNVKCKKSEQPKNNQNRGDYSKHGFNSFYLKARQSKIQLSRTARMPTSRWIRACSDHAPRTGVRILFDMSHRGKFRRLFLFTYRGVQHATY